MAAISRIVKILLSVLLTVVVARVIVVQLSVAPSFDGAMNLSVASSLSKGDGYRRDYAERAAFPHEIQTGAPYILPSAMIFRIFGVGITQSQIVNILYFGMLLGTCYLLVRLTNGSSAAVFAACTVATMPGMQLWGFSGYGEIPALALLLAATVAFYGKTWPGRYTNDAVAGFLAAAAIITKTVMLIGAGAFGLTVLLSLLLDRSEELKVRLKRLGVLVASGACTIAAMEVWRAISLGGLKAWQKWWVVEAGSIFTQAGVEPAHHRSLLDLIHKLQTHLGYLSHNYRFSLWITLIWLAMIYLATIVLFRRKEQSNRKWATLTVLLIAAVYMAWWLILTPTTKAWHRRIIDGMICADLGLIMFASLYISEISSSLKANAPRYAKALVVFLVFAIPSIWLVKGTRDIFINRKSPTANSNLLGVAKRVHDLPNDAYIFGIGWYSAPRVSLLSGRHILDFNDTPISRINGKRPIYFIESPVNPPGTWRRVESTYGIRTTPEPDFAIVSAPTLNPLPFRPTEAEVLRHIRASDNYAYMHGFNESEGANGRWLSSDNLILLRPSEGDQFELTVYALPLKFYFYDSAPRVMVSFNNCPAAPKNAKPDALSTLVFDIPAECKIAPGSDVTVRIEVDNLLSTLVTTDPRPLSLLSKSIGFVPAISKSE